MLKELFETGKSVEAAIESACEKLGCSRDDCEWEIIDLPKKGFLGLKNTLAKVRVSIETPDEKPAPPPTPKREPPAPVPVKRPEKQERAANPPAAVSVPARQAVTEVASAGNTSEKEARAEEYIKEVLTAFGLKAELVSSYEYGGYCINITGDGLGAIIGRRGETLDAIQYLAGLVANRGEGDYLRLTVDCGNYRFKRKDTLESLAKKLANQVIKTDVSKTLEPMNPFERRIIHATVSEIEGVSSASIGEEPNRRVVITSPTARPARSGYHSGPRDDSGRGGYNRGPGPRPPRRDGENSGRPPREGGGRGGYNNRGKDGRDDRRDDRRGDRRDDRRGGRPRQAQQVQQGPPKETPESTATGGISFGKIDLE